MDMCRTKIYKKKIFKNVTVLRNTCVTRPLQLSSAQRCRLINLLMSVKISTKGLFLSLSVKVQFWLTYWLAIQSFNLSNFRGIFLGIPVNHFFDFVPNLRTLSRRKDPFTASNSENKSKTRMHSSRMRTARSSSRLGGSPPGTTPGPGTPPEPGNPQQTPPARHAGIPPARHAGIALPPNCEQNDKQV